MSSDLSWEWACLHDVSVNGGFHVEGKNIYEKNKANHLLFAFQSVWQAKGGRCFKICHQ